MIMEAPRSDSLPPPPGLIEAFTAGFEATANHIAVIFFPVLFDLFLWFGPRVRISNIVRPIISNMMIFAPGAGASSSDLEMMQKFWSSFLERFNMFALLRTMPVGVPSLFAGNLPLESPALQSWLYEVGGSGAFFLNWCLLAIAGWLLGAIFFEWVSRISSANNQERLFADSLKAILNAVVLSGVWVLVAIILALPFSFIIFLLALVSPVLAQFTLLVFMFFFLWTLPLIYFSPHGIFVFRQNMLKSILSSFRMARFALPASGLFILIAFLLSQGLTLLWLVPAENSWWLLVGILGHAFIASALLASSFVYYRNVNAWIQVVMERYKTQATSARA